MYKQTLDALSTFAQTSAESIDGAYVPSEDLEATISTLSFQAVIWGSVGLIVLLIISAFVRDRFPKLKLPLFVASVSSVIIVTLILIVSTIYLNVKSSSGGPVHWHADFEVWACGQEVEYRDPTGALSNKVGTATLHEHNDKRVHLEGVVVEERDASIGKFFYVTDGVITDNAMIVPLNTPEEGQSSVQAHFEPQEDTDGVIDLAVREELDLTHLETDSGKEYFSFRDGQSCPDGSRAEVQAFIYEIKENEDGSPATELIDGVEKVVYTQRKIDNVSEYVINDESVVPPGDCIIFEFSPTKESTDKKCLQFEIQDEELGDYHYAGVINPDSESDLLNPVENEQTQGPEGNELPENDDPEFDTQTSTDLPNEEEI